MNKIVGNQGLNHISLKIFGFLDPWSFAQCRQVCKLWNLVLQKSWLLRKLAVFKGKALIISTDGTQIIFKTLLEVFPDWIIVFNHFETKESLENLEEFVNFMQQYYEALDTQQMCQTPLHYACQNGQINVIQHVLAINVDFQAIDRSGMTPLHWACQEGKVEIVKLILDHLDIDVNISDHNGRTLLHLACENGSLELVNLLVNQIEINISALDANGMTAFEIASAKENVQIVKLLQDYIEDVNKVS